MQQRARSVEDKTQRREALLDAAQGLAAERGGARHVTVAAVAARAGIDPSGMRRYFASKEELLLELAERGWDQWREAVDNEVDGLCGSPVRLSATETALLLARTIAGLPLFCDLLAHVPMRLEGDVDIERARRYKTNSFIAYDRLVAALADRSEMGAAEIEDLIAVALSLTAYLWQLSNPTETLAALYAQEPRWSHAALDFAPRLGRLLALTAEGISAETARQTRMSASDLSSAIDL